MRWKIHFFLLVFMAAFLIMGGIQVAEKGTQRVDGFMNEPSQSFSIVRVENGNLEMTVLGRQYSVETEGVLPPLNKEQKKELKSNLQKNWVSAAGNELGTWVTAITREILNWFH